MHVAIQLILLLLLTAPYGYYINNMSAVPSAAAVANDAVAIDDRNVIMTSWRNNDVVQSANSRPVTCTAQAVNAPS